MTSAAATGVPEPPSTPVVWRGEEALGRLAGFAARAACRSVMLVLDAAVASNGYGDRVAGAFDGWDTRRVVVPGGEPTVAAVDAAGAEGRRLDAPVVVGVGGGSALDIAKQAAVVVAGGTGIGHYLLARRPMPARRPLVAVPTTAGTGAEVTRTCVLADREGRKVWTWSDVLLPDVVVLDPAATVTMPAAVTAATGLDAFVHAVEALTGQRHGERPPEPAQRAIELVRDHLPAAVTVGTDLEARAAMQEAAFLAGTAIDGCGTGMAHSIGHAAGTLHHVPHGVAVAVGLEAVLRWNVAGAPGAFVPVAAALGGRVEDVPSMYRDLWVRSGLRAAVAAVPVVELEPAAVAATMVAEENRPMYDNNCRRANDADRLVLATRVAAVWQELRAP